MATVKNIVALVLLASCPVLRAGIDPDKPPSDRTSKTATNDDYRAFTINNVFNYYSNNGDGSYNRYTSNSAFEFPKGSLKTAIFEDGVLWGGFHKGRFDPKVGGSAYRHALQAGPLLLSGTATTDPLPADALDPKYRVYCVRPDITPKSSFESVLTAVTEEASMIARFQTSVTARSLFDQYIKDWNEWPARTAADPTGLAPFTDINGDGIYDPAVDIPGQPGADQTAYYVANDGNLTLTNNLAGCPPIGLEMHRTIWGYNKSADLDQVIFASTLLINKSGASVDSMFLLQWCDPDVGDAGDDFAGCDTVRNLGYAYNGKATDYVYGKAVPAVGYRLVEGPRVPSPGDSAIFRQQYRQGYRNLGMTAFVLFSSGFSMYADPPSGVGGDIGWYRLMNGLTSRSGVFFVDPLTGRPTKFCVPGDPVTSEGWIDGMVGLTPSDRRFCLSTGPFTLADNDTQEIVVATLVEQGRDRLSSVSMLKYNSDLVQYSFNRLFTAPLPPAAPRVDAAGLDGQVILTWGDPKDYLPLEAYKSGGYAFEGYNVYQLPEPVFDKSSAKLLATYDLVNSITTVFDDYYDDATGYMLKKVVQFGTDSGIKRQFVTEGDSLRNRPLVNGSKYYFAVTGYAVSTDPLARPNNLESVPHVLAVVPETPRPGFTLSNNGDTIKNVTHTSNSGGISDGQISATVVNPMLLTGGTYQIVFNGVRPDQTWSLVRTLGARVDTLVRNFTYASSDTSSSIIIDGIQWRVFDAPPNFKRFLVVSNANGPLDPPDMGTFAFGGNGFPTLDGLPPNGVNDRPSNRQQVDGSKWGIATGDAGTQDGSYGRFIIRTSRGFLARTTGGFVGVGGNWPRIVPSDYEIRFTAAGGKAEMAFSTGSMIDVPFELWNIGVNTPDSTTDDFRMIPWVNDANGNERFDLDGFDHGVSDSADDPETDWLYWMNPTNTTPGHAGYDAWAAVNPQDDANTGSEVMARMVLVNWNGGSVKDPTFPNNVNAKMPETGTIFRILTTKPNTPNDVFTIAVPENVYEAARAAVDVDKVNVFPNPYNPFNPMAAGDSQRHVTFTHLPRKANVRIFNLAGILVRTIAKESAEQFLEWDLNNEHGNVIAGGMYVIHIDMPELGKQKILKLGVAVAR